MKKALNGVISLALAVSLTACSGVKTGNSTLDNALSYDDAVSELDTFS